MGWAGAEGLGRGKREEGLTNCISRRPGDEVEGYTDGFFGLVFGLLAQIGPSIDELGRNSP